MLTKDEIISKIKPYCQRHGAIVMVFLFGSYANERACKESDIDIAIFFKEGENSQLEITVHNDLERILKREVELVNLTRCFATLSWNIIRKGIPIVIKDRKRYLDFMLECSNEAVDFIGFNLDTWRRKNAIEYR